MPIVQREATISSTPSISHMSAKRQLVLASDYTGPRILAYLASMREPRNSVMLPDTAEKYNRGISVIRRIAKSCKGQGEPTLALSRRDCADVLFFMYMAEPVNRKAWWDDSDFSKESHVCGWMAVIRALELANRSA